MRFGRIVFLSSEALTLRGFAVCDLFTTSAKNFRIHGTVKPPGQKYNIISKCFFFPQEYSHQLEQTEEFKMYAVKGKLLISETCQQVYWHFYGE